MASTSSTEEPGDKVLQQPALSAEIDVEQPWPERDATVLPFPDVFYDPTTKELLCDPVVDTKGDSHERRNKDSDDDDVVFFPNRALKSVIEHEVQLSAATLGGSLRRLDQRMKSKMGNLLESSSIRGFVPRPLPDAFYCPIAREIMAHPVITKDGYTYERESIVPWIKSKGVSPMTREPLRVSDVRENNALYELIQAAKTQESPHESIRRWIDSSTTTSRRSIENEDDEEECTCMTCIMLPFLLIGFIVYGVLYLLLGVVYVVFFLLCFPFLICD